jgi:hypothetical protein
MFFIINKKYQIIVKKIILIIVLIENKNNYFCYKYIYKSKINSNNTKFIKKIIDFNNNYIFIKVKVLVIKNK